jgi:hypothetical protein
MSTASDPARQLLRHTVATVAYRGGKALRGAPASFAKLSIGEKPRTPAKILAHLGDLFAALKKFDDYLASLEPLRSRAEGLFQGPVADALTHIGQIAMLRRLAGCPIKGENYFKAEVTAGRVGIEQAAPQREFD